MNRIHEIAMGCTPFLDGKWRYLKSEAKTEYRQIAVLQDDTERERRIILSDYYRGEGRLQVIGNFPDRYYNNQSITISTSRAIPHIAADINRRFLPQYLQEWEKAQARHLENMNRRKNLQMRVNLLQKIDSSIKPRSWGNSDETEYFLENGKLRLSPYDDFAYLDIKLNFEQLIKILYLLKEP